MAEPQPSLRERKKAKTRKALMLAAFRLFRERGYEATTLEGIAAEVEVHVQTLLRYFGTKEDLAIAPQQAALDDFREQLRDKARDQDVLAFWQQWIQSHISRSTGPHDLDYIHTLETVPVLRARYLDLQREYEDLLATALALEAGTDPATDLYARARASTLISVHFSIARTMLMNRMEGDLGGACLKVTGAIMKSFPSRAQIAAATRRRR